MKISFFFEKFLFDVQLTVNVGDCQEFGRLIFGRKIVGFTHTWLNFNGDNRLVHSFQRGFPNLINKRLKYKWVKVCCFVLSGISFSRNSWSKKIGFYSFPGKAWDQISFMQSYLPVTLRLQTSFMCHSESSKVLSDNLIVIASENKFSFKKYFRYLMADLFFLILRDCFSLKWWKIYYTNAVMTSDSWLFAIGRLVLSLDQIRFFGGNCNCSCERQNGSNNNETCCQVAPVCLPTFGIVFSFRFYLVRFFSWLTFFPHIVQPSCFQVNMVSMSTSWHLSNKISSREPNVPSHSRIISTLARSSFERTIWCLACSIWFRGWFFLFNSLLKYVLEFFHSLVSNWTSYFRV